MTPRPSSVPRRKAERLPGLSKGMSRRLLRLRSPLICSRRTSTSPQRRTPLTHLLAESGARSQRGVRENRLSNVCLKDANLSASRIKCLGGLGGVQRTTTLRISWADFRVINATFSRNFLRISSDCLCALVVASALLFFALLGVIAFAWTMAPGLRTHVSFSVLLLSIVSPLVCSG